MVKLVIADDEPLVCAGLKNLLKWKDFGIEIAGTARNGGEAASLIEKIRPELVIADIRMPVKSGLDLAEESAKKYGKLPLFIILTSYEEVEYYRRAIGAQVVDYLVKIELTGDTLSKAVEKALSEMSLIESKTLAERGAAFNRDNHERLVKNVEEFLQHRLDKHYTLREVAEAFLVSPNYLSHLFSRETGSGFTEYCTALRMRAAREMLSHEDIQIYEVAEKLGYENPFYFSTVFKKATGLTPREFASKRPRGQQSGFHS